jgi:hypothetical protein
VPRFVCAEFADGALVTANQEDDYGDCRDQYGSTSGADGR